MINRRTENKHFAILEQEALFYGIKNGFGSSGITSPNPKERSMSTN